MAHPNGGKGVETQIPFLTSFFELATHPLVSFSCCWAQGEVGTMSGSRKGQLLSASQEPKGIPGLARREQGRADTNILTQSQTHQAGLWWWGSSKASPGRICLGSSDPWQGHGDEAEPKSRAGCRAGVGWGLENQIPWAGTALAAAELLLQSPGLGWNGALGQGWDAPAEAAQGC